MKLLKAQKSTSTYKMWSLASVPFIRRLFDVRTQSLLQGLAVMVSQCCGCCEHHSSSLSGRHKVRVTSWDFSRWWCCCRNNGRQFCAPQDVSDILQTATARCSSPLLGQMWENILAEYSQERIQKQKCVWGVRRSWMINGEISLFSAILKQLSETEAQKRNRTVVF